MGNNNYLKIFAILGFIGLAGFSCWLTAESWYVKNPTEDNLAFYGYFALAVAFYCAAAYGTKLIVDALNTSNSLMRDQRMPRLLGGLFLAVLCWIIISLPTNTHTMAYRNEVLTRLNGDLEKTRSYVKQLELGVNTQAVVSKIQDLKTKVEIQKKSLSAEIMNPNQPGDGPKTQELLNQISSTIGCSPIAKLSGTPGVSNEGRKKLVKAYHDIIDKALSVKVSEIETANVDQNRKQAVKADAAGLSKELAVQSNTVKEIESPGLYNYHIIKNADKVCKRGYDFINVNKDLAAISAEDKPRYEVGDSKELKTQVTSLESTWDFIVDVADGKYEEGPYWLLWAFLIDLVAFVFFDIAFKSN